LLNTTVSSLALAVNDVLSQSYRAIYGGTDEDELILRTSPLAATAEVQSLYTAGLIDFESSMPAALHSLGCSAEEIASALERRRKVEKEAEEMKKIEDKTNKAELARREKDAINPPKPEGAGQKPAAAAKKPEPKPDSDGGGD
jgi:predicted ATP-grasp superfamily ATP-dependent carboligase